MAAETTITTTFGAAIINTARSTALTVWTPYASPLSAITSASAGTVTEITAGVARKLVTFGAPASGATDNTALISFGTATSAFTIVGLGLYTAVAAGSLYVVHKLNTPKVVAIGDPVEIAIGALDWSTVTTVSV